MNNYFIQKAMLLLSIMMLSACSGSTSNNTELTELQNILVDTQTLNTNMSNATLTSQGMCNDLLSINASSKTLLLRMEAYTATITAAPIDAQSLQTLDDISAELVKVADSSTALSLVITELNNTTEILQITAGLEAMLRLSSDIGKMADRILEMSGKILIMADNIGLMADRIIVTQQIQSDNLALTQASILATQTNSISLFKVVSSSVFNPDLDAETLDGNTLASDITATVLTETNMAAEWANIATNVNTLKLQIETTYTAMKTSAASNTSYVDVNTYPSLSNMSAMIELVATATQGQVLNTNDLSATTTDNDLSSSMGSILEVSSDIGVMANHILEMADLILVMADNIGLVADQIVVSQQSQSTNYAATLTSVEASQLVVINIITTRNL